MFTFIDKWLNQTTMYRVVLYCLIFYILVAMILSSFGILSFNPIGLILSVIFITAACWVVNKIFAHVFAAPTNVESVYITALILALIITPPQTLFDLSFIALAGWASVWSTAAKYILAIRKKHIFNPAAFGVALVALTIGHAATWWIGTLAMLPFVIIGGYLVVRKIRRYDLVISFLIVALLGIAIFHLTSGLSILTALSYTPILFFATIMLTEPLTSPPRKIFRIYFGILVGILFVPSLHIGGFYFTPEIALLVGNIFAYIVSPKQKLILALKQKIRSAQGVYDFIFTSSRPFSWQPGQYLEWTLAHSRPDARGNRRYFTIASSPTENDLRIGVRSANMASSFKKKLLSLDKGSRIVAAQLAGDFVLPQDETKKLVFIAGGIGVTPFRSMIKYLIDSKQSRSITLLYANRTKEDIAYKDLFDAAGEQFGLKTIYAIDEGDLPAGDNWVRKIDAEVIKINIPDYAERYFYLSGPRGMVLAFEKILKELGVGSSQIKTDFFPGFA